MILDLSTDSQDINDDFKRIASEIMNDWILKIDRSRLKGNLSLIKLLMHYARK
jgi:hypothetical protein